MNARSTFFTLGVLFLIGFSITRNRQQSVLAAGQDSMDGFGIGSDAHLRVGIGALESTIAEQQEMGLGWARESIPWGEVVYDFRLRRSRDGPNEFHSDFSGYLQTDAYSGYNDVYRRDDVVHLGCWAHYPEIGFIWSGLSKQGNSRVSLQRR